MIAQSDPEAEDWIFGVMIDRPVTAGSFLHAFVDTCLRADDENYMLLRPVVVALRDKYPQYSYKAGRHT